MKVGKCIEIMQPTTQEHSNIKKPAVFCVCKLGIIVGVDVLVQNNGVSFQIKLANTKYRNNTGYANTQPNQQKYAHLLANDNAIKEGNTIETQ